MEHFYTLQGEGFYTGRAAYFIRLGGCDVGCVWCDVKESWDASAHPQMSVAQLLEILKGCNPEIVVVTGGEPTMHNLNPLFGAMKAAGYRVHIETSGTNTMTGNPDWITLSPKKFKPTLEENLPLASELKIVVFHPSDLAWAEGYAEKVNADCRLYLQPEWSNKEKITPLLIEYIQKHQKWQLSLQTHKYINIP